MVVHAWPALACVGWKTAKRFPPCLVSARVSVHDAALSSVVAAGCALHGASLFFARAKKSKQKKARPCIRPCAARRVRSLHRRSRGRLTRAILGPLSLSPHPCGSTPYAANPLTRLKGNLVSPVGSCMEKQSEASNCSYRQLGPESPSGGRTQALRRGTRGMDAERGTKDGAAQAGRPFVTCLRSDAGVREVWSRSGQARMQGAPSLWLLLLGAGGVPQTRESDAPCKAQPVARAEESAAPFSGIGAQQGGKRCAVFHPAALGQKNTQKAPPAPNATPACRPPRHPGPYQTPTAKVPQC
ncbi:hypothetical protein SSTU70S_04311 [Stutzerimonas stutzeri]